MYKDLIHRTKRKLIKLRLQPIRVFCIHHVSDVYDPLTMWECDWVNTDEFKRWIYYMQQQKYLFISLPEAYQYIRNDIFRCRKYAVLTADDGFKSVRNILPWLEEQQIPITLFVNPKYIFQDIIGSNVQDRLNLTHKQCMSGDIYMKSAEIYSMQSPLVTFAYHGYEHLDERDISSEAFIQNVDKCVNAMADKFLNIIPFYAHTYGRSNRKNDDYLKKRGITPVYVSGNYNYNQIGYIDRELISNERLLNGAVK